MHYNEKKELIYIFIKSEYFEIDVINYTIDDIYSVFCNFLIEKEINDHQYIPKRQFNKILMEILESEYEKVIKNGVAFLLKKNK